MGRTAQLPPDQEWRRQRLQALVDHPHFGGKKVKLGQALGYKTGAFVRQMLDGERPVSEKTVAAVHASQGGAFRGWFDPPGGAPSEKAPPPWPFETIAPDRLARLTTLQRAMLENAAAEKLREIEQGAAETASALSGALLTRHPSNWSRRR